MGMKNKPLIWLVASGITIAVLVVAGLGLAGAFDSSQKPRLESSGPTLGPTPTPSLVPTPTPAPNPNPVTTPTPTSSPGLTPTSTSSRRLTPTPTPSPVPTPTPGAGPTQEPARAGSSEQVVALDPDYENALRSARFSIRGWTTDFSLHSVPFDEIRSGGPPRDGIPPLDSPQFTTFEEASRWLEAKEPVIALEINGDARAYPLQILIWHEIVNDSVGGVPVTVTFCPLCNSAIVFERELDGVVHDFGTSGNLRNSDLIMWDRQTESWWQQFTGEGIVGQLTGKRLTMVPASIISWDDFGAAHPDGLVLSRDTGFSRDYGSNPYGGYDQADRPPFLYRGDLDGRLLPKERVVAVTIGDEDAAFPFSILEEERVAGYMVGGNDIVVYFKPGTRSALDSGIISLSREIGATGVFDTVLDGQTLTFRGQDDDMVDNETGSIWNILGKAVAGPLLGKQLTPVVHANHFWFSWGAFKPETKIYKGAG